MSARCGGTISYTEFLKFLKARRLEGIMMATIRKRVKVRGHYRYKIRVVIGDSWRWEK